MNFCCITRRQTDLKWKGNFISRDLLFHAKRIKEAKACSTRTAIKTIQNRYSHFLSGKNPSTPTQLSKIVRDFLKSLELDPLGRYEAGGYRA